MECGLTKIPKLNLACEQILRLAESNRDLITYAANKPIKGYVTDLNEVLIMTHSGGYLRIGIGSIPSLIEELQYIQEDVERRRRD